MCSRSLVESFWPYGDPREPDGSGFVGPDLVLRNRITDRNLVEADGSGGFVVRYEVPSECFEVVDEDVGDYVVCLRVDVRVPWRASVQVTRVLEGPKIDRSSVVECYEEDGLPWCRFSERGFVDDSGRDLYAIRRELVNFFGRFGVIDSAPRGSVPKSGWFHYSPGDDHCVKRFVSVEMCSAARLKHGFQYSVSVSASAGCFAEYVVGDCNVVEFRRREG